MQEQDSTYTQLPVDVVRDSRLSYETRGLLAAYWSFKAERDEEVFTEWINEQGPGILARLQAAFDELGDRDTAGGEQ